MEPVVRTRVIELTQKYLDGGNAQGISSAAVLKSILDAIRDFVEETESKVRDN